MPSHTAWLVAVQTWHSSRYMPANTGDNFYMWQLVYKAWQRTTYFQIQTNNNHGMFVRIQPLHFSRLLLSDWETNQHSSIMFNLIFVFGSRSIPWYHDGTAISTPCPGRGWNILWLGAGSIGRGVELTANCFYFKNWIQIRFCEKVGYFGTLSGFSACDLVTFSDMFQPGPCSQHLKRWP